MGYKSSKGLKGKNKIRYIYILSRFWTEHSCECLTDFARSPIIFLVIQMSCSKLWLTLKIPEFGSCLQVYISPLLAALLLDNRWLPIIYQLETLVFYLPNHYSCVWISLFIYPADFTYPDTTTNKMTGGVCIIEEELYLFAHWNFVT